MPGSPVRASEISFLDVYYGDSLLDSLLAHYDDSTVRFEDPGALLKLLPETVNKGYIAEFFASVVEYQSPAECHSGIFDRCFPVGSQDKIVVTFDPDSFALNIYIAADLLQVYEVDTEQYLPPYSSKPSYLADVGAIYSTSETDFSGRSESYNVSLDQVISVGDKRLHAQMGRTGEQGFYARSIAFVSEHQRNRLQLGRYEIAGDRLTPSRLVQGFGIHTTTDLRLDLDQNGASQLDVFLPQRSRVEIYRDSRLLSARFYPIGSQQLDVSELPDGAYDIEIRVVTNGIVTQSETRFFTKSTKLPPVGENQLGFDYGRVASPLKLGTEDHSGFIRLAYAHRLNEPGYLEFSSINTHFWSSLQSTYSWLRQDFFGDVAVHAGSDGYRAVSLAFSRRLLFGVLGMDWAKADVPSGLEQEALFLRRFATDSESSALRYSYTHRRWAMQLQFRVNNQGAGDQRVVAATGTWLPLDDNDNFRLSTSFQHSDRDGLRGTLDLLWRIPDGTKYYWARSRWSNSGDRRVMSAIGVTGAHSHRETDSLSRYNVTAEERDNTHDLIAEILHENRYLRNSSAVNIEQGGNHARALSTNFHTTLAASGKGVRLFGGAGRQSGILVSLLADQRDPVSIIVNGQRRVSATSGGTHFIPLEAYDRYTIRVQPRSGTSLEYDTSEREVILYPGHIPVLEWQATRVVPVFGQVFVDGLPEGELITVSSSRGQDVVENGGFFVAEVTSDAPALRFQHGQVPLCQVQAASVGVADEVVDMGAIECGGDAK